MCKLCKKQHSSPSCGFAANPKKMWFCVWTKMPKRVEKKSHVCILVDVASIWCSMIKCDLQSFHSNSITEGKTTTIFSWMRCRSSARQPKGPRLISTESENRRFNIQEIFIWCFGPSQPPAVQGDMMTGWMVQGVKELRKVLLQRVQWDSYWQISRQKRLHLALVQEF